MSTFLSQMNYGFSSGSKPVPIGEGDNKQSVVSYQDFSTALNAAEETLSQVISQHNAALVSQEETIGGSLPSVLDTGSATAADCAAAINNIITILTNLNTQPK